jgi:hypothetical protein
MCRSRFREFPVNLARDLWWLIEYNCSSSNVRELSAQTVFVEDVRLRKGRLAHEVAGRRAADPGGPFKLDARGDTRDLNAKCGFPVRRPR